MNDAQENQYPSGNAALFHTVATQVKPIYCEICDAETAEFVKDYDKYEIYRCPVCKTEHWVAVR